MHGFGWDGHTWPMAWMWIGWALVVVAMVAVTVWVARSYGEGPSHMLTGFSRRDPAEEILRQRYARGEINRDEFRKGIYDLRHHGGAPTA